MPMNIVALQKWLCAAALALLLLGPCVSGNSISAQLSHPYAEGLYAISKGRFKTASDKFFDAMFELHEGHSVDEAYTHLVMACKEMGQEEEAYIRLGEMYHKRGMSSHALSMVERALSANGQSARAHMLAAEVYLSDEVRADATEEETRSRLLHLSRAAELAPRDSQIAFRLGALLWDLKAYDQSATYNEIAYSLNKSMIDASMFSIYQRNMICKWGSDGQQYDEDMRQLIRILGYESRHKHKGYFSTCIQPHMALGFDMPADLKLRISQSHAEAEKAIFSAVGRHEPMDLPRERRRLREQFNERPQSFRIRVGYVSANIKSKTTVYMAQDLLRFHDRSRFEVHVYATTPPDTPRFLELAMRGTDWRKKVAASVEHFHEVADLDVFALHRLIRAHGIHILLNWDGYSNNGVRPTGLFAMQPSPIQIAHQEYIGTVGADYIQYMITDPVASPRRYESFYSEKFIWLPSSFLATSMAYLQPDMQPPSEAPPHPERRGCGGAPASFVYCNFNKQLKFDPHVFREWLRILQSVPDSVLCLLENPRDSLPFIRSFVHSFDPGLDSRVRFQEFENNPFDNQRRDAELCNAVLDTPRYNGHTTAADNLWAGVPIVAYGNSVEMGGRVGASILMTLGMPELIAKDQEEYSRIAVRLGRDPEHFLAVRAKLVAACLSGSNPYWDLERYMKNLESGFQIAFFSFLNGRKPAHIRVRDAYDPDGLGAARCPANMDGSCSPAADGDRWPWAGPDALEAFYVRSRDDVARDDERNAAITPEPRLDYHGVTQEDIEAFTEMTLGAVARDEVLQRRLDERLDGVAKPDSRQGHSTRATPQPAGKHSGGGASNRGVHSTEPPEGGHSRSGRRRRRTRSEDSGAADGEGRLGPKRRRRRSRPGAAEEGAVGGEKEGKRNKRKRRNKSL